MFASFWRHGVFFSFWLALGIWVITRNVTACRHRYQKAYLNGCQWASWSGGQSHWFWILNTTLQCEPSSMITSNTEHREVFTEEAICTEQCTSGSSQEFFQPEYINSFEASSHPRHPYMWHRHVEDSGKTYIHVHGGHCKNPKFCTKERTDSTPGRSILTLNLNYHEIKEDIAHGNVWVCFQESEDVMETISLAERRGFVYAGLVKTMRMRMRQPFRLQGNIR